MALRMRLSRGGAKKRPYYRIVVADSRMPRDGRFIERVGTYDPMLPQDHPQRVVLKEDRIRHWLDQGATPSDRVARFLGRAEVIPMPQWRETPKKSALKAKALKRQEEAAAEAEKRAAAVEAEKATAGPEAERPEAVAEAEPQEVAGETEPQEVAGEAEPQEIAGETEPQDADGAAERQKADGETGE